MVARRHRAAGFTLVELLVVITIIAMLMGMVFPAFNQVREAFNRMACGNNQGQLGHALQNHFSAHNSLPVGVAVCSATDFSSNSKVGGVGDGSSDKQECMGPNWLTCILDGLGEREIAENFRLCSHVATNMASQCPPAGALQNPGQRTPDVLKCPSAIEIIDDDRFTGMGYQNLAKGNYAACYGAEFYMNNPRSQPNGTNVKRNGRQKDGMFGVVNVLGRRSGAANVEWGETIALPEGGGDEFKGSFKYGAALDMGVRPGTSDCDNVAKTILLSEVVGYESPEDGRGAWVWGAVGATAFTAYTTPNADGRMGNINYDRIPACEDSIPEDDPLHCQRRTGPSAYAAARSMHPGLVVVLFADYHSTPITDAIDAEVWKSMASKSGPKEEGRYLEASGY